MVMPNDETFHNYVDMHAYINVMELLLSIMSYIIFDQCMLVHVQQYYPFYTMVPYTSFDIPHEQYVHHQVSVEQCLQHVYMSEITEVMEQALQSTVVTQKYYVP